MPVSKEEKAGIEVDGINEPGGGIERQIPHDRVIVPKSIELDGDCLVWEYDYPWGFTEKLVNLGDRILEKFLDLADANGLKVLRYARQYGVLGLCEHDLPYTHNPPPVLGRSYSSIPEPYCVPRGWNGGRASESIDTWRYFARVAMGLIRVARSQRRGNCGQSEDWQQVYQRVGFPDRLAAASPPGVTDVASDIVTFFVMRQKWELLNDQLPLQRVVNEWINLANVRPCLSLLLTGAHRPVARGYRLNYGGGLFGVLGVQLAYAVAGWHSFDFCSGCGRVFHPEVAPRTGQRRYCQACRDAGKPVVDAKRDYRLRKKGKATYLGRRIK